MAKGVGLSTVQRLTDKRRKACHARLSDDGMEAILKAIEKVPKSDFLRGLRGDWGGANFDFLLKPDSVTKILEGKYDGRSDQNFGRGAPRPNTIASVLDREIARTSAPPDGYPIGGTGGGSGDPAARLAVLR